MTALAFAPVDEDTADLLDLIASKPHGADVGAAHATRGHGKAMDETFLAACKADYDAHGYISANRVRELIAVHGWTAQTVGGLWARHTGKGRAMRLNTSNAPWGEWPRTEFAVRGGWRNHAGVWCEANTDRAGGNYGKELKTRLWVGN